MDNDAQEQPQGKKKKSNLPLIIVGGLAIGAIVLMRGSQSGGNAPNAGDGALLSAQTQDNALGASLQQNQDNLSASLAAENMQNNSNLAGGLLGMFQTILGEKYSVEAAQQQNKSQIDQTRIQDHFDYLTTRSDNATSRIMNASNNKTNIKTTDIVAQLEQELQAAQTAAQEYETYIAELGTGALGAIPLPGTGAPPTTWGRPTYPITTPIVMQPYSQPYQGGGNAYYYGSNTL